MSNSLFNTALKLKGYGSFKGFAKSEYNKIQQTKIVDKNLKVKPTIITCLKDYFEFIKTLESSYENPVFYRGQGNANFLINPSSLRVNPENEHRLIENFHRHFPNELDSCTTDMARLVMMQHFGLGTRALDVSENPLASLYFACSPMKKFCQNRDEEMSNWGEIYIFRDPNCNNETKPDDIKTINSTTVSIMASTAFMEKNFSLWKLGMEWKKDNNYMREEKYIPLGDIIRKSVIVRVPQNNPRIKNQQGAFIIVNANEVSDKSFEKNKNKAKKLTEFILENPECNFEDLLNHKECKNDFENTWDLEFKKIKPYSDLNEIKEFRIDPFNLRRLFYKDKEGIQQVALIPPEAKQKIIDELKIFNITEDFIYPDMDNVAHEIMENINRE